MPSFRIVCCALLTGLLYFSGCDSAGPEPSAQTLFPEVIYRTSLTDRATGATALASGDLIVYGLTEGRIAPTDGTNAFPLVLRLRSNGTIADKSIYRDNGFGRVVGAAPLNDGLAVLTTTRNADDSGVGTPRVTLYRTDRNGTRQQVLHMQSNASAPPHALLRSPDGGLVVLTYPFDAEVDQLVKLDASGTVAWTYRMPEVQDIRAAAVAPDGDLFVLGAADSYQFAVARLAPDGQTRWRRTYGDDTVVRQIKGFAAVGDGFAVLTDHLDAGTTTIHLTRFNGTGDLKWDRTYATGTRDTGSVDGTALTALGDEALAVAWTEDLTLDQIGGYRAEVVRIDAQGEVRSRHRFGPQQDATTMVSDLLPYTPGHFVAVGSIGPERLGGYGGDDFDVLVKRYNRPQ